MGTLSTQTFYERFKKTHPFSEIEISNYQGLSKLVEVSCKKCGKAFIDTAEKFLYKKNFCCDYSFKSFEEKSYFFSKKK